MIPAGLADLRLALLAARDRREALLRGMLAGEAKELVGKAKEPAAGRADSRAGGQVGGQVGGQADGGIREEGAVLFLSTNLPGERKSHPEATKLFTRMAHQLLGGDDGSGPPSSARILCRDEDVLGPYLVARFAESAEVVKRRAMAEEDRHPWGRLMDADVYNLKGDRAGREDLGLAPRRCLVCDHPARECILLRRHDARELERARDLLLERADRV